MIENTVKKIDTLLRLISNIEKPFRLIIVIGAQGSGKSTLIHYLSGQRYVRQKPENELTPLNCIPFDDSGMEISVQGNTIFFEWRLFQPLLPIKQTAKQFLLSHLLRVSDSVVWLGTIDYNHVHYEDGEAFTNVHESFNKEMSLSDTVKQSIRWIATQMPDKDFFARDLLEECQKILKARKITLNRIENMTDIFFIDDGASGEILLNILSALPSVHMPIPLEMSKHAIEILHHALSDPRYIRVSTFFLEANDSLAWLQYALAQPSELNNALVKQLIRRLIRTRMADPYDENYEHRPPVMQPSLSSVIADLPPVRENEQLKEAGRLLQSYDDGSNISEVELFTLCDNLEVSERDNQSVNVEVLSEGVQVALITRHNQYILKAKDPLIEQEYFDSQTKSVTSESLFEKMLSSFKMVSLLKQSDVELMQSVVSQFDHFVNEQWEGDDVKTILKHLCHLLHSFDTGRTLEQVYLRPLLYLLDDDQKTLSNHSDLPLSAKKLTALKQLYQTLKSLYEIAQSEQLQSTVTIDYYGVVTAKILHALLVLTEQDTVLADWLSSIFMGDDAWIDITPLMHYVTAQVTGLTSWMNYLETQDQLMNLATFQALNLSLDDAEATVLQAVIRLIEHTVPETAVERGDYDALIIDIRQYIDLSQLNVQSGFIRHYALLLIAAQYYERRGLDKASNHLLSMALIIRVLHQLSAVRTFAQLMIVLNEIKDPLANPMLSGQLGKLPQIAAFCGIIYTVLMELQRAKDKVDFGIKLINTIESKLPKDSEWCQTLSPYLSVARTALVSYSLLHTTSEARLIKLKEEEERIRKHALSSTEDLIVALRLFVSAQYLYELPNFMTTQSLKERLLNVFSHVGQPISMIWEQHELTATFVLLPHLIKSVDDISAISNADLSIENCFRPLLVAIQESHKTFEQFDQQALLPRDSSNISEMIRVLNNYLAVGNMLYQFYQTGKTIMTKLKSLHFCQKGLERLGARGVELVNNIQSIYLAIQNGNIETAQTAIQQFSSAVNAGSSAAGSAMDTASNIASSVVSCTTILGVLNLAASLANIAVTVYYSEKIMAKVDEITTKVDRLGEQQEEILRYVQATRCELQKIATQIDHGFNQLDQSISSLKEDIALSFHHVMLHQKQIIYEIKEGFEQMKIELESVDDNNALRHLEDKAFDILTTLGVLEQAVLINDFDSQRTIPALKDIYLRLTHSQAGLRGRSFNGAIIHPDRARQLFFLQPLLEQSLPNLGYWIQCCFSMNHFLNHFSTMHSSELISLYSQHITTVEITYSILQALNTTTTAAYIGGLLDKLLHDQANVSNYKHIHLIARLCGFSLHQLGEQGFKLWEVSVQTLNAEQQRQKNILEACIIEVLKDIFRSTNSLKPCSGFVLSVQSLLRELIEVGARVFQTKFTDDLRIQNIWHQLHPQTRILITDLPEDQLLSRSSRASEGHTRYGFLAVSSTEYSETDSQVIIAGASYER